MLRQRSIGRLLLVLGFLLASGPLASAQDWPQWRGPGRDGLVKDFVAPAVWPKALKQVWRTPVGSGYSSPVVANGKAWIHTRTGDDEIVSCLDWKTGKLLWSNRYAVGFKKNQYATEMASGPFATPLLYRDKLYTLGVNGTFSCFDAASGTLKWRKDFGLPDTSKMFCGTAGSPVAEGDNVIIHVGDDIKGGTMIAFDAVSGREKWQLKCDGPGYASPIIVTLGGVRQLVTMTDKSVLGVAAQTGQQLWSFPWPDTWNENIVTPTLFNDLLIFSGVRRGTVALRPVKETNAWTVKEAWQNPDIALYMNSPVLDGAQLYGLSAKRKGQFFCLDAATGKVLWATEGREGNQAAVLKTRDLLLILTADSNLIVARKHATAFTPLAKYSVADSPTYAHPVITGKQMLVKDDTNLTLWSLE
ncbi:MAG: PQQ-binding-like beta-propeller repeat protein [Acidobacteriota bacterium]